ncbi:MAG: DNA polymerase IV [Pseudomonadota bacterium]|nr:DNA polymerase IV [Pseudomonadota bacterium]
MERRIAHIDMDAFFASCELSRYPELRGRAVVVAGHRAHAPRLREDGTREFSRLRDYVGRGVLTTATYEARALGVHSGMPAMKAARLAPDAVLLPVSFELYRRHSRLFKDALRTISPHIQDIGIDEVYADITLLDGASHAIAQRLKAVVFEATGLTCSVGIAPNKLLAKLSSDMQKPDGITVLDMADLPSRIWPLPARRINGIGPKAAARLESLGISTIGELAARDKVWLMEQFGRSHGSWLHDAAHGRDERPVLTHSEPVSMSRETTFERNLHSVRDRTELGGIFTRLCEQLAADLRRKGYAGRTIGIKLRFDDFRTVTRDLTLHEVVADATAIRQAAGLCLKRVDLRRALRLIGVRVSALERAGAPVSAQAQQSALDFD